MRKILTLIKKQPLYSVATIVAVALGVISTYFAAMIGMLFSALVGDDKLWALFLLAVVWLCFWLTVLKDVSKRITVKVNRLKEASRLSEKVAIPYLFLRSGEKVEMLTMVSVFSAAIFTLLLMYLGDVWVKAFVILLSASILSTISGFAIMVEEFRIDTVRRAFEITEARIIEKSQ